MLYVSSIILLATAAVLCEGKTLKVDVEGKLPVNHFDDTKYLHCGELRDAKYSINGTYRLHMDNDTKLMQCEFANGNAFTNILQRQDNSLSFVQTWSAYEYGFGALPGNYWAGLQAIYAITSRGNAQLQINMQDWSGQNQNVIYRHFALGPRDSRFRLSIGGYQGTAAGDSLSYHNGMPFSTYDAPDPYNCARDMRGGWWYNYCAYTLPTGLYYYGGHYVPGGSKYDGLYWMTWHGYDYSIKFLQMIVIH